MEGRDRSSTVLLLVDLIKESKLDSDQITKIINIINNLSIATENQKKRFMMYYGLNTNGIKSKNFTEIAKIYGCTVSAIRCSVITVKNKLSRLNEEFDIIEEIVNSFEN